MNKYLVVVTCLRAEKPNALNKNDCQLQCTLIAFNFSNLFMHKRPREGDSDLEQRRFLACQLFFYLNALALPDLTGFANTVRWRQLAPLWI